MSELLATTLESFITVTDEFQTHEERLFNFKLQMSNLSELE